MPLKPDLERATAWPAADEKSRKRFYLLPCLLFAAVLCQLNGQLPRVLQVLNRVGAREVGLVSYIGSWDCFLADQNDLQPASPLAPGLAWSPCPDVTDTLCSYLTVPLGTN